MAKQRLTIMVRSNIHACVRRQAVCGGRLTVAAIWHMSAHETGTGTTLSTTSFEVCVHRETSQCW